MRRGGWAEARKPWNCSQGQAGVELVSWKPEGGFKLTLEGYPTDLGVIFLPERNISHCSFCFGPSRTSWLFAVERPVTGPSGATPLRVGELLGLLINVHSGAGWAADLTHASLISSGTKGPSFQSPSMVLSSRAEVLQSSPRASSYPEFTPHCWHSPEEPSFPGGSTHSCQGLCSRDAISRSGKRECC